MSVVTMLVSSCKMLELQTSVLASLLFISDFLISTDNAVKPRAQQQYFKAACSILCADLSWCGHLE